MRHKNIKTSSEVVVVNLFDRTIIERIYDEFTYENAHRMLSYYGPYKKGSEFQADRDCPTLDYLSADIALPYWSAAAVT